MLVKVSEGWVEMDESEQMLRWCGACEWRKEGVDRGDESRWGD
jgi:hypothetical protein